MHRQTLALGLALAALCITPAAYGWGDQGHQIVCAIALKEVSAPTRAKITKIMAKDTQYHTFWEACIWPDHPKKRRPEHFVNVPRDTAKITTDTCAGSDQCLFDAIHTDLGVLSDPKASAAARLASLKYLGHWMGDLHQPLHVSFADDRGGNEIKSTGLCSSDLHADWDTCLVVLQTGKGNPNTIAKNLRKGISDTNRSDWKAGSPATWADESYQVTIAEPSDYCVEASGTCQYDSTHPTLTKNGTQKTVTISQQYVTKNGAIVKERMQRAGVRLAKMLDDALANQ